MRRKNIIVLATIAGLALIAPAVWPRIAFYMLTGRFAPIQKIETLLNPIAVTTWSPEGLHLADGRTVQIPGLRALSTNSPALAEATKRGVEVHADGRIWGLVRVHHWCGNDPVRKHIARVDLADMLMYLRVGEPIATVPEAEFLVRSPGGTFSEWGWRMGEFLQFQEWEKLKNGGR